MEELSRTEMLLGKEKVDMLRGKSVIVFGIGGVGGYTCEALARSGIGKIALVDNDLVSLSNINRQIIALHSTVGRYKVDVMKERINDINPYIEVVALRDFLTEENIESFNIEGYDYVVDAIDTVKSKIALAALCDKIDKPLVSSMGAGNKTDPCAFKVSDIYKTSVCPLARSMRTQLKKLGVKRLKVVYSEEKPISREISEGEKRAPASCSFVPSVVGLIVAAEVIKDLINS